RLNDALPRLFLFNQSIGRKVSVSGFLRCVFNSPGFKRDESAHIFEIHPVRIVELEGELHCAELNVPASLVQDWTAELNDIDERREVRYWKGSDTLVFSNGTLEKTSYVRVTGTVSDVKLNLNTNRPAWFILTSAEIARQVKVTCLQGTRAAHQLRELQSTTVNVTGLRSIDLARALEDRYRINLL